MSELVQGVKDGKIVENASSQKKATKSTSGTSELGKDAFLQLLVTQMKYQDPLNPNTDTQFVAQLATFSQLEQMQNLSKTSTNSQAFSLVGRDVVIKAEDGSGGINYKSGMVDFVTMSAGEAKLSVGGNLYSLDQLYEVIDGTYLIQQGLPGIEKATKVDYDLGEPKDITFTVKLGESPTQATKVAVYLNGKVLDDKYITLKGNTVTINKDALVDLEVGSYKATIGFNDSLLTTVSDKLTVQVKNSKYGYPGITKSTTAEFDLTKPQDISFAVSMGESPNQATKVSVYVNGSELNPEHITLKDNTVTISKDALSSLEVGSYKASVKFNDSSLTTVDNKLTIQVKESEVK